MEITFRDLYEALQNTEASFTRMDVDIDNALCGNPKCVLTKAQERLLDSYMELANVDMDFCSLNFDSVLQKMKECFDCIDEEIELLLPVPPPEPAASVGNCTGKVPIVLNDVTKFIIYEYTYTSASIISPVQAYIVPRAELPKDFTPSVPAAVTSHEKYSVSWNSATGRLKIKLDHDLYPDSMGAPTGSYNITMVVAELSEAAQSVYGTDRVTACRAFLMTEGVEWKAGNEFDKTVDGNPDTYPAYSNNPSEVVVEYAFLV